LFDTTVEFSDNVITFFFQLDKMNKKCLCQHNFDDHVRGWAIAFFAVKLNFHRFYCKPWRINHFFNRGYNTKRSLANKFWNGSE